MAIILDNFDTDTQADWTAYGEAYWQRHAGDGELIQDWGDYGSLIHDSNPGSIEQESQQTGKMPSTTLNHWAGPGVRLTNGNGYCLVPAADYTGGGPPGSGGLALVRYNAETITVLQYFLTSPTPTTADWITLRLAASGAVGANVVLDVWYTHHGTKPSDPGWIGVDGAPTFTYTDTDAARLDDAGDIGVGPTGLQNITDATRTDFWKARAISDRTGGNNLSVVLAEPVIGSSTF